MRSPRPYTEKWLDWKTNRKPGETYEQFVERVINDKEASSTSAIDTEEPEDG